jgi:lysophospholipid acyltransferase (LPLAT)-like uncharacterized protein
MFKRVAKSAFAARLASVLIGLYLRLLGATARNRVVDCAHFYAALAEGRGVIIAFWHGRLMTAPFMRELTQADVYMLISNHRDGEIIANGVRGFGLKFIRGSAANPKKPDKSKQGASAVAQMIAALESGQVVGITPDGPRGPGEKIHPGALKVAQLSGAPIVPVGASASRGKHMKSWDRFLVAGLFSRLCYITGEPIRVSEKMDASELEIQRVTLEERLLAATARADELAGRKS